MTEYSTSEGDGEVELCAVLIDPKTAPRGFVLSANTRDGSAGMYVKCSKVCYNEMNASNFGIYSLLPTQKIQVILMALAE